MMDDNTVTGQKIPISKKKSKIRPLLPNNIKVLYTNADQFPNKKDDLLMFTAGNKFDIIMITEMIPKQQKNVIPSSLLNIDGYELFCNFDVNMENLGASGIRGTGIYVRNEIVAREIRFDNIQHADQVWVEIPLKDNNKLLCGCIYRSPSGDTQSTINSIKEIGKTLIEASNQKMSHILIAGDFNLKGIDWENEHAECEHEYLDDFLNDFHDCFLYQHVKKPTRYRSGESPNLLDLIMTNEEGMIPFVEHHPGLGKSDHECLVFDLKCSKLTYKSPPVSYNYYKGNYTEISKFISKIDWNSFLNCDIKEAYTKFINVLETAAKEYIPLKTTITKTKNIFMDREAIKLRNTKNILWRKYCRTNRDIDLELFKKCRNKLRANTRKLREQYEVTLTSNIKDKPKAFWKYVKSRLKTRTGIPSLTLSDGTKAITNLQKAEALSDHFSNVFNTEDIDNIPFCEDKYTGTPLSTIVFTPEMIKIKLLGINGNKSPGPDSIHPFMLECLAEPLCEPLSILFNKSMKGYTSPDQWLEALITAIYKKGEKNIPDNYRPISLTSVISKVFESIVRDAIVAHMNNNSLFADEQHGFVPKRNCATQLLVSLEAWNDIMEESGCVDIIYTDFSKAFDSVPHERLLRKVESYGIKGNLLKWIKSFLLNRRQRVKVGDSVSICVPVKSGVPQGSVLGPILFVLFINDMPSMIMNTCRLFADDAKIFCNASNSSLQDDINSLALWSKKWQLPFNVKKCKSLHIGKNNPKIKYSMDGHILEQVENEKDLGVIIDKDLKFHAQSSAAVKKANQILGLIKKTVTTKNETTIPLLYMTLVRPLLEYANVVWGPHYRGDQQLVEKVQKRATKMIENLQHLPYDVRLRYLNLPSLLHRRRRGDMIMAFKIMTGRVRLNKSELFNLRENNVTRGHRYKIFKQHATSFTKQSTFCNRIVNDWNSLPKYIVESSNVNAFKNALDKHWYDKKFETPFT